MNLNTFNKSSATDILGLQIYTFFFSLQNLVEGIKMFLIIKLSCCQPELVASPTTVRTSLFTATLLPDVVDACFSFPSTTQTSHVFQTTWKWNVKSGGGHVCVISFISIRFWWLFLPLGHRLA